VKVLNIIETAYRATLEEQDDPVVWIVHAMKGAGGEFGVVLRGNAVNYGLRAQGAPPLAFGARQQKHRPQLPESIAALAAKGVEISLVREDLEERGIATGDLVPGLRMVRRADIPKLMGNFDQVWHW
jgi:hypothetical protein